MKSIITILISTFIAGIVPGQQLSTLPISLKNFSVDVKSEKNVEVKWDIIHQNSAVGYSIEHSLDSKNWQPVGFVPPFKNDNLKTFSYIHKNPGKGMNYYRIHFKDNDETVYYSDVRIVSLKTNTEISLWPNPTHDVLHVQHNEINTSATQAKILNQHGMEVIHFNLISGVNKIDIGALKTGVYFLYVNKEQKGSSIIRFIKG
jgi:hypothetical protein